MSWAPARSAAQLRRRQRAEIAAVEAAPCRRSARSAAARGGRPSTCRSPIRRRAPASRPAATSSDTPSTARTTASARRAANAGTTKCFVDVVDARAAARSCDQRLQRRLPAARQMAGRRRRRAAAAVARQRRRRTGSGRRSGSRRIAASGRHAAGDGRKPRSRRSPTARDRAQQAHRVGVLRARRTGRVAGACSTISPAYITATSSHISATTPRSWVMSMHGRAGLLAQLAQQVEDLRLDRDVERGGRLVGDQQRRRAGERHGDHHALAHAAGQLVRILVDALSRARECGRAPACRWRRARAALARQPAVAQQRLADLVADGEAGLSEVIGSWKIIAMRLPRRSCICRSGQARQVASLEQDGARHARALPAAAGA